MKKRNALALVALLAGFSSKAAVINEWSFETDGAGATLSSATNSGPDGAVFEVDAVPVTQTDGQGGLVCSNAVDGSCWTNGALLRADVVDQSSGVRFFRYDVDYDMTSELNDSGTLLGLAFADASSTNLAGIALKYDVGTEAAPPAGITETPLATELELTGSLAVIAQVDLSNRTLNVWYNLSGDSSFNATPDATITDLNLTDISELEFRASGDFIASTNRAAVIDNIRTASSWAEITALPVDYHSDPVLSISVSAAEAMDAGETNTFAVVISNSAGTAPNVASTLTHDGNSADFEIIADNSPVILLTGKSVTNTYDVVANTSGFFTFTAQAYADGETNGAPASLDLVVGANVSVLTNGIVIEEISGGSYPGLYEPGETLEITIVSTNIGSRTMSDIINTLTAVSGAFAISPASDTYAVLERGASTSTVYQVTIGAGMSAGSYTFNAANSADGETWSADFDLDVFVRQPYQDRVKADNNDDLDLGSSWTDLIPPNATDRAVMDGTVTSDVTTELGSDLSWRGIVLAGNSAAWTISSTNDNTLTIGEEGIDISAAGNDLTISNTVAFGTDQLWNVSTSGTLTVSGTLCGTNDAGLVKDGEGTLVLGAMSNSYSGGTVISNGTIMVGAVDTVIDEDEIASTDALGSGLITLCQGGALGATTEASQAGLVDVLNNDTELADEFGTFNPAGSLQLNGNVSGLGSLIKTGSGTLYLNGNNTFGLFGETIYGGAAVIHSGTLGFMNTAALPSGTIYMTGGTFYMDSAATVTNDFKIDGSATVSSKSSASVTLSGNISGSGTLTRSAAVKLTGDISGPLAVKLTGTAPALTGNNTFTGGLTLSHSTTFSFGDGSFGSGPVTLTGAGYLNPNASMVVDNDFSISGTHRLYHSGKVLELAGPLSGTGGFNGQYANGTLTLSGNNSDWSGSFSNFRGTLKVAHPNALGSGGTITVYKGNTPTISVETDLSAGVNKTFATASTGGLIFDTQYDMKVLGAVKGSRPITKTGAGNLILNGVNTHSGTAGTMTVNEGILTVNGSLASSLTTIATGATLAGTGTVDQVTMQSGSTLRSSGGMTFTDKLLMDGNVKTIISLASGVPGLQGPSDRSLTANGDLVLDFSDYDGVSVGDTISVFEGWGLLTDDGVEVYALGLPADTKLDTSGLFVDGTVTVVAVAAGDVEARSETIGLEIIVQKGSTNSATLVLSNPTAGALSYTVSPDGAWPTDGDYVVTTQQLAMVYIPEGFTFSDWDGTDTLSREIGFDFDLAGISYRTFSVSQGGVITLESTDGETATLQVFDTGTDVDQDSILYKQEDDRLIVEWGDGTLQNFQAWLDQSDGTVQYHYGSGVSGYGSISIEATGCSESVDHTPSQNSLRFTPTSWISYDPILGTIPAGGTKSIEFTADASDQESGFYFADATIEWGDGAALEVGLFVDVVNEAPILSLPVSFTFSGPVGYITPATMSVTNTGDAELEYVITNIVDYAWVNWSDAGGLVPVPDTDTYELTFTDDQSGEMPIGFPFIFFGTTYTNLSIDVDGRIILGDEAYIYPFYNALSMESGGDVRYYTDADKAVVLWENLLWDEEVYEWGEYFNSQTFQAILYKDGRIRFKYDQLSGPWPYVSPTIQYSDDFVVGDLWNVDQTMFVATNYVTNVVEYTVGEYSWTEEELVPDGYITNYWFTIDNQAIEFTPEEPVIVASPMTGTIPTNSSVDISLWGDARGFDAAFTNSTTLLFNHQAGSDSVDVTFIATNSVGIPQADADGDGMPDLLEYAAGTDAGDADSIFEISSQQETDGSRSLSWPAALDPFSRAYTIWYTTNLTGVWIELDTVESLTQYTDGVNTNESVIFYKVTAQ